MIARVILAIVVIVMTIGLSSAITATINAKACGETFHSSVTSYGADSSFQQFVLILGTEGISSIMVGTSNNVAVDENYHSRTLDYDLSFSAINRHTQWFSKIENDNLETEVFSVRKA